MDKTRKFTDITVDEVMPVQPGPLSAPVGYKVIYVDAEKLQPAMAAVHQDKDRRSAQDYIAHIDKALSRGKYTEALLASWEHMVQFGSFPEGTVNRIISAAPEKDWSRSLVKLIANPPGPNDLEEYTKSFQTVADYVSAPNKYELNVHLADLYLQLGDAQKAYDMLAYALAQNPYLTGAWVTLGDVFYRQFDMEAAFACWDAALAVEPSHALVGKSAKLREELVSLYPEFF